jgi:acyl carrier protein
MIPAAFVMVDELPLTPNGKVNHRALPLPAAQRPELPATYVAPQTELELTITRIWQEALRLDKVGIHDNFFDLGGHSLLIAQVNTRLREALKRDVSMVEMFNYPTINSLAGHLSQEHVRQPSFQRTENRAQKQREARSRAKQSGKKSNG